jgi:hypothetical protein
VHQAIAFVGIEIDVARQVQSKKLVRVVVAEDGCEDVIRLEEASVDGRAIDAVSYPTDERVVPLLGASEGGAKLVWRFRSGAGSGHQAG